MQFVTSEMQVERAETAFRLLASSDLGTCGHRELDALAGALQRIRGFVAAFDVQLSRRRDELTSAFLGQPTGGATDELAGSATTEGTGEHGGADAEGPSSETHPSTHDGSPLDLSEFEGERDRRPGRAAQQDRARAEVCSLLPTFERALAAGHIDTAHVDAVASAWSDLDSEGRARLARHGAVLLDAARSETPERFRRRCRDLARQIAHDHGVRVAERQRASQRSRRWIDQRTGMGHLHVELDPENTARVWTALDEHLAGVLSRDDTAGIPPQRLEVDALVELVTASARLDPRAPDMIVVVDLATLESGVFGPHSIAETSDGQPLPPAAVRRLACEANLLPVVLGGDGVPVDVGRSRRLATREQRRALAAMYATCGMPGCEVRFERCRIHHLDPWVPVGVTDLENLLPVCSRHHHDVHEGGWTLTMTPDRVITLVAPDGTLVYQGDTRDRPPVGRPSAISEHHHSPTTEPTDAHDEDRIEAAVIAARQRAAGLGRRRCRLRDERVSTGHHEPALPRRGP